MCTIHLNVNKTSRQLNRECTHDISVGKDLLSQTKKHLTTKEMTESYIKIKNLCASKDIKKVKRQVTE